jgi:uncharacterized paraquat-inducible protein A
MIKVDMSTAITLFVFLSVVGVLVLWIFLDLGTRLRNFSSEEKYIWHCGICDYTYIDSRHEDISRCPRCKSYIDRNELKVRQREHNTGGENDN